ncbi:MAG: histidine phosphatase family protein [Oscillospiraceae bacterium]|nr:histidine phosphatase family protein [Oscillospiraceae bacterium]
MKIQVYLIRHGKTAGNLKRAYIGSTDQPLSKQGREELLAMGRLAVPDALWRSPLRRCGETAAILYPAVPAQVCADLRECDFGAFEGKTYDQLKDEPGYRRWLDCGGTVPFPGGEDPMAFRARSRLAFGSIAADTAKRYPGGTLAVVCHGGTIMAVLEAFSDPRSSFYDWQAPNGGGYRFFYDPDLGRAEGIIPLARG